MQKHIAGFHADNHMSRNFADIGLDSFGLLTIRAEMEAHLGFEIADDVWTSATTPADLARVLADDGPFPDRESRHMRAGIARDYDIGMPQMADAGLSEIWLLKEAGDLHWRSVAGGLGAKSSALCDQSGNRLYATFTRVRWRSPQPLSGFRENESARLEARMSRFGAGIFLSEQRFSTGSGTIELTMMSAFSRRSNDKSNTALTRGQPQIPGDCSIPQLDEMPAFGIEAQARRKLSLDPPLFETEYELLPIHDINGVGLVYFAAFAAIAEICGARFTASAALSRPSRIMARDICYFSNCDPDDRVLYRLHSERIDGSAGERAASLARRSDGTIMAHMLARKALG